MIVAVSGEKGGVGKTTIATNLAAIRTRALIQEGKIQDLLLIDTDKQHTASYWCSLREDNNIEPRVASIQKFGKSIRKETIALREKYEDIVIDAGGRDSPELRSALLVADKGLIPLRPSQFDLWTLGRMNMLIETAQEFNEALEAFVLINQSSPNPAVKEEAEARELIKEFSHLKLLKTNICERIVFRRAALQGMAITEYKPEDNKAVEEVVKLYEEIYNETE